MDAKTKTAAGIAIVGVIILASRSKADPGGTTYTITTSASPAAGGTTSPPTYTGAVGSRITLTATANNGYTFSHWTMDGQTSSASASLSFTLDADHAFVAVFQATGGGGGGEGGTTYTITTSASPAAGGTTSPPTYTGAVGSRITLTATANNGYTFSHWTKDGITFASTASLTVTLATNSAYVAIFEVTGGGGGGTQTGSVSGTTNQPLVLVVVTSSQLPSQVNTASDFSGVYSISGIPMGAATITYSLQGYTTITKQVTITTGNQIIDVSLVYSGDPGGGNNGGYAWPNPAPMTPGDWVSYEASVGSDAYSLAQRMLFMAQTPNWANGQPTGYQGQYMVTVAQWQHNVHMDYAAASGGNNYPTIAQALAYLGTMGWDAP